MLIKLFPQQIKSLRLVHKGLVRRYEGHFPIPRKVGKVSLSSQATSKVEDPFCLPYRLLEVIP